MAGEPWHLDSWNRKLSDPSHWQWEGEREGREKEREHAQEMKPDYKPWKPTPLWHHPPAKLYLLKILQSPPHSAINSWGPSDQTYETLEETSYLNHRNHHRRYMALGFGHLNIGPLTLNSLINSYIMLDLAGVFPGWLTSWLLGIFSISQEGEWQNLWNLGKLAWL